MTNRETSYLQLNFISILLLCSTLSASTVGNSGEGCSFDPSMPMFSQVEDTSDPITSWDFVILSENVVENTIGWPSYKWMPDGHISSLKVFSRFFQAEV